MYEFYDFIRKQTHGRARRKEASSSSRRGYMFKDVPKWERRLDDPVEFLVAEMDRHDIRKAIAGVDDEPDAQRALREYPDRFFAASRRRPERGHGGGAQDRRGRARVRPQVRRARSPAGPDTRRSRSTTRSSTRSTRSASSSTSRSARPRACPGRASRSRRRTSRCIDEVCWFFPELKFVTRHGCEPWTELAVKLLLKWPNLYYSTTAFAPKHYPKDIIDFANTRGADKIICAGYFPAGLTLRPHLRRAAGRPVPRPRLAEVPARERGAGLQAPETPRTAMPAARGHPRPRAARTSDRCSSRACCSPTWAPRCCASTAPTDVATGSNVAGFVSPYSVIDRGRRSVGIDLKHPTRAEVVLRLCEQADVLLEGFRPGVAERLGVGPDACRGRNDASSTRA